MNEAFDIFLKEKRIDPQALKKARASVYVAWAEMFKQLGPLSFDQQKKFVFNPFRLEFPYNAYQPKAKPERSQQKKKLTLKKPILTSQNQEENQKTETSSAGISPKKPLMKRPVMNPKGAESKQKSKPSSEDIARKKPIMKRPIMKPNRPPGEQKSETSSKDVARKKPVMKRPIMKPQKKKPDSTPD